MSLLPSICRPRLQTSVHHWLYILGKTARIGLLIFVALVALAWALFTVVGGLGWYWSM